MHPPVGDKIRFRYEIKGVLGFFFFFNYCRNKKKNKKSIENKTTRQASLNYNIGMNKKKKNLLYTGTDIQ